MTLAAIAIVLPAAYFHSQYTPSHKPLSVGGDFFSGTGHTKHGLEIISHGTAVLLLVVYLAYLLFEASDNTVVSRYCSDNCIA
jgi:Ca2+:H+ antiporter